ncbi:two-component system sensor histidine kinase NtrB [Symbiobacterium terraclitae]|uniref:two-component system sensor histidine kinase NtrB n=1 Tax=Symbiobacterium terraclitae TaxID=557451 RepID=UPI0035B4FBC9
MHATEASSLVAQALEGLLSAVIVTDDAGVVRLVNSRAREFFGPAAAEGRPLEEAVSDLLQVRGALAGRRMEGEQEVVWQGRCLAVWSGPILEEGGRIGGAVCQAREAGVSAGLVAGAAHEIRNPLAAIRGGIQLMQARGASEHARHLALVLREIDRMDRILRDLLLAARPPQFHPEPLDAAGLVREVLQLQRPAMVHQGVVLAEELAPEELAVGDPALLHILVLNLVVNGLEAMPDGGRLRVALFRPDAEHLVLEVADTGQGIPENLLPRLFEPYLTTKPRGTGLGLAICRRIVQLHGGDIAVESSPGRGTRITATLRAPLPPDGTGM